MCQFGSVVVPRTCVRMLQVVGMNKSLPASCSQQHEVMVTFLEEQLWATHSLQTSAFAPSSRTISNPHRADTQDSNARSDSRREHF